MTSKPEKSTLLQQVDNSSGRRQLDQFSPSTRQRTTFLANQIPRHNCFQLCAGRLHLQSDFSKKKRERTVFERPSTPRPAPEIVLKGAWQSQQQQQQQSTTSESAASGTRKLVQKNPTYSPELPASGD